MVSCWKGLTFIGMFIYCLEIFLKGLLFLMHLKLIWVFKNCFWLLGAREIILKNYFYLNFCSNLAIVSLWLVWLVFYQLSILFFDETIYFLFNIFIILLENNSLQPHFSFKHLFPRLIYSISFTFLFTF